MPIGAEDKFHGIIDLVRMRAYYFDGDNGENVREEDVPADLIEEAWQHRHDLVEKLADFDDHIAEMFLDGKDREVTAEMMKPVIRKVTIELKATPVFIGSALKNKGVQILLDGVIDYLPNPTQINNEAHDQNKNEEKVQLESTPSKPFVALAFKLEDGRFGQLTYMRIYQGKIGKGDFIINCSAGQKKVKVPRLVRMHSNEMNDIAVATAGDIVAMFGVDCSSGDTFTDGEVIYTMTSMHVPEAVISLAVAPKEKEGQVNFSKALNRFTKEDPTLRVHRDEESAQTIMSGMGELHLDIYIERMRREYNCEVVTGKPQVAYRETITRKAEFAYTHKQQTGGKGQFARVIGYIEPLPADAVEAWEFVDDTVGGSIPREFIPACEKGFKEAVTKGSLIGFPVVGVRINVNDGAFHAVDSSEQAFKTASIMAFREGYAQAKPTILEPIMKVEVQAPEEFQGAVMGQINQRRGIIVASENTEGYVIVTAEVPLNEMFGYSTDLRSGTQGKGEFTMEFLKYKEVPKQEQEVLMTEYRQKKAAEQK
jgi:elongation factor G